MFALFLCALAGLLATGQAQSPFQQPAASALRTIQDLWFEPKLGSWSGGMGWWNMANTLETLSYYMIITGEQQDLLDAIQDIYDMQPEIMILTAEYNDDVSWWSLAWAKAYELTKNPLYLNRSELCFAYVTESWDNTCNGGVWWSRADSYKNAITNELFLMASTTLYRLTSQSSYLTWAQKEWQWFQASGMINSQWMINDGLTSNCVNNNETTWTYNQGVILGGLINLYLITNNNTLIDIAVKIANATTHTLIYPNGVLREPCESGNCGADGSQFKGVFIRYLGYMTVSGVVDTTIASQFIQFINLNAQSNIQNNTAVADGFSFNGVKWEGPYANDTNPAIDISSVLDCFNAAVAAFK